jgi:micrococcal nuclease
LQTNTATVFVIEIIDGDTFKVRSGESVRLSNVCAPEKGRPGWVEARDRLARLILSKTVTLEVVARDTYGRPVANVWVNSTSVNETMRRYGYRC